jgi:multiple sugar transport system permease protein
MQGRASAVNYGITMAGSMITFLPPFILYIFLQKYFIKGIAGSGLKV